MKTEEQNPSLAEAAALFLTSLPAPQRQESQQELNKFVRWYGGEQPMSELTARDVASYAEGIGVTVANVEKRLEPVKSFLSYAKKEGLTKSSLAPHLRVKKTPSKTRLPTEREERVITLTQERYLQLQSELAALKRERPRIADELRRAREDKDIRENVPFEAARERQGQLEARIREIDTTLRRATILDEEKVGTAKVELGTTVTLCDLASQEQLRYTLVSPNEVDLAKGKISTESPVGKALLDRSRGETIEVAAPAGTLRYRIEEIER